MDSKIRSLADVPRPLSPKEQGRVIMQFCEMGMPEAAATYARGIGMDQVAEHVEQAAAKIRADIQAIRAQTPTIQAGVSFTHPAKGLRMHVDRDYSLHVHRLSDGVEVDPETALGAEEFAMVASVLRQGKIDEFGHA